MALLSKMETPEKDHRGFDILVNEGVVQAHIKHIWPTSVIKVVASPRVDDGACTMFRSLMTGLQRRPGF